MKAKDCKVGMVVKVAITESYSVRGEIICIPHNGKCPYCFVRSLEREKYAMICKYSELTPDDGE